MKRHTNPYSLPPNSTVFNTIHHIPTWGRFPAYPVNPAAPIIPGRLITHNSLALNKILTENRSLWAVLTTCPRINIRHNSSLSSLIHAHRRLLQQLWKDCAARFNLFRFRRTIPAGLTSSDACSGIATSRPCSASRRIDKSPSKPSCNGKPLALP